MRSGWRSALRICGCVEPNDIALHGRESCLFLDSHDRKRTWVFHFLARQEFTVSEIEDYTIEGQVAAQAGYPVTTVPTGTSKESGMPYDLAIINTAFSGPTLIKYASAIKDPQETSGTKLQRTFPEWRGYLERDQPVNMY
ncbi:hypothetical protein N7530_002849 [Penicillium desertorum]|uniref:Uncharacterized protein n=1 Tax=Penicillium desertorum TaxID=1303715 RepID=A0A9W9X495_9EURO|nr:hypothetical protein N7530_002849 [Penicillium desertorum]